MMRPRSPRRGVTIMWSLVIISVLSMVAATAAWQCMAARSGIDQRQHQMAALWLARSGAELAADQLRDSPEYAGGTLTVVPGTRMTIAVEKTGAPNEFRIRLDATVPADGPGAVTRTRTWKAIRRENPAGVRLDLIRELEPPREPVR